MRRNIKKPIFGKICIVGVGLIGGSLGMAIKKKRLADLVVGVARRKETLFEAFRRKAIDIGVLDLKEGVRGASLVILCGPVSVIEGQLERLGSYLDRGCVVMDVGSTKSRICAQARKKLRKNIFIGCHPMAGSEKSGIKAASSGLFNESICFMTRRHSKIQGFWRAVGAKPALISPLEHDRLAAATSHLPHVMAFSFFQTEKKFPGKIPNPSARELLRLAKSDSDIWADILISNRDFVLREIEQIEKKGLSYLRALLVASDKTGLIQFIKTANRHAL